MLYPFIMAMVVEDSHLEKMTILTIDPKLEVLKNVRHNIIVYVDWAGMLHSEHIILNNLTNG